MQSGKKEMPVSGAVRQIEKYLVTVYNIVRIPILYSPDIILF